MVVGFVSVLSHGRVVGLRTYSKTSSESTSLHPGFRFGFKLKFKGCRRDKGSKGGGMKGKRVEGSKG